MPILPDVGGNFILATLVSVHPQLLICKSEALIHYHIITLRPMD